MQSHILKPRFAAALTWTLIAIFSLSVFGRVRAVETPAQCFVSSTTVWTESGPRAIETLAAGDLVWVEDEAHGQIELKPVTAIAEQQVAATLRVNFTNGEQIEATTEHPIYVEGTGFKNADELVVGDSIVTRVGPSQTIASLTPLSQSKTAYSFTVADCNTYFVGQSGFWVSH